MREQKTIFAIVPCYNEETQVERVVRTMPKCVDRIVVIDDCSSDQTRQIVATLSEQDERIVLIVHPENRGVGGAITSGYEYARDKNADVAVVMAGDGQMCPTELPRILQPVLRDQVDYAKGNRLTSVSALRKMPFVRFLGVSALSLVTKIVSGYWHIGDSQSGYTAINREMLRRIDWQRMYPRYGQPNDLLVRLSVNKARVCDVPIEPVYNVGERSGIRISRVTFSISWLLAKLFCWRIKHKLVGMSATRLAARAQIAE